jgi:hypothetical protein
VIVKRIPNKKKGRHKIMQSSVSLIIMGLKSPVAINIPIAVKNIITEIGIIAIPV